eukprot:RCo033372
MANGIAGDGRPFVLVSFFSPLPPFLDPPVLRRRNSSCFSMWLGFVGRRRVRFRIIAVSLFFFTLSRTEKSPLLRTVCSSLCDYSSSPSRAICVGHSFRAEAHARCSPDCSAIRVQKK